MICPVFESDKGRACLGGRGTRLPGGRQARPGVNAGWDRCSTRPQNTRTEGRP